MTGTFSNIEYELVHIIADGELVAAHTLMRATHSGQGLGVEPTGRDFEVEQMHLLRLADGRIAEHWGVRDDTGMMRQLGLTGQAT